MLSGLASISRYILGSNAIFEKEDAYLITKRKFIPGKLSAYCKSTSFNESEPDGNNYDYIQFKVVYDSNALKCESFSKKHNFKLNFGQLRYLLVYYNASIFEGEENRHFIDVTNISEENTELLLNTLRTNKKNNEDDVLNDVFLFCEIKAWLNKNDFDYFKQFYKKSCYFFEQNDTGVDLYFYLMASTQTLRKLVLFINQCYGNYCKTKPMKAISVEDYRPEQTEKIKSVECSDKFVQAIKKSHILNIEFLEKLYEVLDERFEVLSLELIYGSLTHGRSLHTLFRNVKNYLEEVSISGIFYVLIILDNHHNIFGAFLTDPPHMSQHFYGTGECFLFKYHHGKIKKYNWDYKNATYYIRGDRDSLDIGSFDGKSALFIEESLRRGRTQKTPIFNNEPLTSPENFFISCVELWALADKCL